MDIIPLQRRQLNRAAEILTRAFYDDPIYVYIAPDLAERDRAFPMMWKAEMDYCLRFGEVYTTPDLAGIAAWLRPGDPGATRWRMIQTRFAIARSARRLSPEARCRMSDLEVVMDQARTRIAPMPHWYLWAIGIEPDRQGQGIGSALLDHVLKRADGFPCYLETESESNVEFYERRGFRVIDVARLGVPMWFMLRE